MALEVNDLQLDKLKVEVRNERYLDSMEQALPIRCVRRSSSIVAQLEQEQAKEVPE